MYRYLTNVDGANVIPWVKSRRYLNAHLIERSKKAVKARYVQRFLNRPQILLEISLKLCRSQVIAELSFTRGHV